MNATLHADGGSADRFECDLRERIAAAGAQGITAGGLRLPRSASQEGRSYRAALERLLARGDIGNLGTVQRPRYVGREHFKPLEIAHEHIAGRAREAGVRLSSKRSLAEGLRGAPATKADEALKLLVAEQELVRLRWAGRPVYVHASALPAAASPAAPRPAAAPSAPERPTVEDAALRRAYQETVREFGYPDVLIHEIHLRLGGELEPLKESLRALCRIGQAVPGVGDWSLSTDPERAAALYIQGRPHLRIRLKP